jgi:Zn-dependent protease
MSTAAAAKVRPSWVFLLCVALTAAGGALAWTGSQPTLPSRFGAIVMIVAGWIVTLCLHEFAHAYTAWKAGDTDIAVRGYLTLDPRKYTNPLLSIIIPVAFIILGGIGLPGGAVYVRNGLFKPAKQAQISLMGPLTNLLFGALLLLAIRLLAVPGGQMLPGAPHSVFWDALAFLAFLQLTAAVLNLIPMPGLDGYGVLEPFLSPDTRRTLAPLRGWGMLILLALLFEPHINRWFFTFVYWLFGLSGVPAWAASVGSTILRFWT